MEMRSRDFSRMVFFFIASLVTTIFLTYPPLQAEAVGTEADAMCICQMDPKVKVPPYCPTVPCKDVTSGFTTSGICSAPQKCLAKSAADSHGAAGVLGQLAQMLKGGSGGGEAAGEMGPSGDPCVYGANVVQTVATTSSITPASPCAQNTAPSAYADISNGIFAPIGNSGIANSLFNSLNVHENIENFPPAPNATASTTAPFKNESGVFGDIVVKDSSVLTTVSTRDAKSNVQVSGFMGVPVKSKAAAQQFAEALCTTRPWLSNFLSAIVPSALLDKICVSKKIISVTPAATKKTSSPPAATKPTSVYSSGTISLPSLPGTPAEQADKTPQAIIWAVPEKVFKNNKTTIYWKAANVVSCTVRSADGSEFGTGISGNRATPTLTRATVYTYACETSAGLKLTTTVGIVVE